jgi:hypothetical protein
MQFFSTLRKSLVVLLVSAVISSAQTPVPVITSPNNASQQDTRDILITWESALEDAVYTVQVATQNDFEVVQNSFETRDKQVRFIADRFQVYYCRVQANHNGEKSEWAVSTFAVLPPKPSAPELVLPINLSVDVSLTPALRWESDLQHTYQLQVARSADFSDLVTSMNVMPQGKVTEVILGGLDNNTTYFWRVRSISFGRHGDWSERGFTTERTQLVTPVLTTPPANSTLAFSSTLDLSWQSSSPTAVYDIDVATDERFNNLLSSVSNHPLTTLKVSLLSNNKQYFWRVKARDNSRTSDWSMVSSFTFGVATQYVVVPAISFPAHGSTNNKTSVDLKWTSVEENALYDVELSPTPQFYTTTFKASSLNEAKQTVSNLSPGMTYFWRVRTTAVNGMSPWSSVASFTTGNTAFSPALKFPMPEQVNVSTMTVLQWDNVSNATEYSLQVSPSSNFRDLILDVKNIKGNEYSAQLPSGQLLFWRVRSVNEFGEGTWSPWRFFRTEGSSTSSVEELTLGVTNLSIAPNPTSEFIRINYTIPSTGMVAISIADVSGNIVATIAKSEQYTGAYEIPFDASSLAQGVYVVSVNYNGIIKSAKVSIIR